MTVNLYPLRTHIRNEDYLNGALAAARFIRESAIKGEKGVYWVTSDDKPQLDLYCGSAGVILFLLQISQVSGDATFLEDARLGGDFILHEFEKVNYDYTIRGDLEHPFYAGNMNSFYIGGLAGVAYSLIKLSEYSNDSSYEIAALKITERIVANAQYTENGVYWSGYSGIVHDSGVILYLLYAAKHFGNNAWRDIAAKGGHAVVAKGVVEDHHSVRYVDVFDAMNIFSQLDQGETHCPNFAHGTSGMSYMLARLFEETGDPSFLIAAERGANLLINIAQPMKKGKLIPHSFPQNSEDLFYLGFCHGPVGTSRLFLLLHRLTEKDIYKDFYSDLLLGIDGAGAPEHHSAGYWQSHGQCCGTAGFVGSFLSAYAVYGDQKHLDLAERSSNLLLGAANYNGEIASWSSAPMRVEPNMILSEVGYMRGAAGIGQALLQFYSFLTGSKGIIYLPDDPFNTFK